MKRKLPVSQRGRFVTFEGPEGGGKSTQVRLLARRLTQAGIAVYCTREPGGTPVGNAIRNLLQYEQKGETLCSEAELLLFMASRAQHVREVILPRLDRGIWVISDRFADSTTVYQGYARGLGVAKVLELNRFAVGRANPDLTLLLDIDVVVGFRRIRSRNAGSGSGRDRIEREAREFHNKVRHGYLDLARRFHRRISRIDAGRTVGAVANDVWKVINRVFRNDIRERPAGHP